MIDKITKNNNEIEYYYNIGSIHGDIRMMLSRYIYNDICFNEIIRLYEQQNGKVENIEFNFNSNTIAFDVSGSTLSFQEKFANCMYHVISKQINSLHECIDLFEKNNPKYNTIKNNIDILTNQSYYITLFRTSFIKHEKTTSCIIQL